MARMTTRCTEGVYVSAVAALAVMGAMRQEAFYNLLAITVTLPLGVAAAVAIYGGYALIKATGGLFVATTLPDGSDAVWLSVGSAVLDVAVLCGAALGNVLLLHPLVRQRRQGRAGD
jgi:chromate transport protein ChrA